MPYATTTLAQAQTDLATRVADPNFVRWTQAEWTLYLQEALRTWNALTGHFRDTGVFQTTAGVPFYDVTAQCPAQVGQTVLDQALVTVIEYHLLEPPTPTTWTGSLQFTLNDLTQALQRRRDQFLLETGMVLTRTLPVLSPVSGGRFSLSENVISVRRAAFQTTDGVTTPMKRDDVWSFNHFATSWVQNPGRSPESPFGYSVGETPPLTMQIVPPPSDIGTLDLISVNRGAVLNPATGVLMGIPDDWTWVVKWGALADLLAKDGLATDVPRGTYAESRWQQGLQIAKTVSRIWDVRVNNMVQQIGALTEIDDFHNVWQNLQGQPTFLLSTSGWLVGLSPVPNAVYGVTMDLIRNAPIPILQTDFLQVGPELLDVIYDYCEHLALVKEGADGIASTQALLDRFMRAAGVTVAIETAQTPNLNPLTNQSQAEDIHTPRLLTSA